MITLSSLFQDGAVLQRDMDIPVWGEAHPDTVVEVVFDGISSFCRSSARGDFTAWLPPHDAGGPFEMRIKAAGEELCLHDILVGEVWLCSGQSNMQYLLSSDWRVSPWKENTPEDQDPLGRIQEKQFNSLVMEPEKFRFFHVEHNLTAARERTCRGQWYPMSPENSGEASAVAAWFGFGLQYRLDVPIGLIISSKGGSSAEAWMSEEALHADPETRQMTVGLRRNCYGKDLAFWDYNAPVPEKPDATPLVIQPDSGNEGFAKGYAANDFDDTAWKDMKVSGSWKQQNIAGNGAVWFRKKVLIPPDWENVPLELRGGSVDKHDITYFNNCEIGRTGDGVDGRFFSSKRSYDIAPSLVKKGENLIAIRGFSYAFDGSVSGNWFLVNKVTGKKIALNGIWKAMAEYDRGDIRQQTAPPPPRANDLYTPAILFNGMFNPLIPYAMRGVIWYQGENNTSSLERAKLYRKLMKNMINDWRIKLQQPDLAFIMVQLAGYGSATDFAEDSSWAFLRESQRQIAMEDPGTFMISAIDLGEEDNIHPENKLDVGKRLAMSALHHVYGIDEIIPGSPEVLKAERSGNSVCVSFRYGSGLELRPSEDTFFLAGKDGVFYPADHVAIKDDRLIVASDKVDHPCELRYAWSNFPPVTLFNKAGFPVPSFRIELTKE